MLDRQKAGKREENENVDIGGGQIMLELVQLE